ncbi:DUF3054 domain-containing protein [Anaerolineales bacterium HSG6]|nr:DUF3054 domain-containing protein [Anaerolineales bacterium HSG6]MDM8532899.1 DUF3054 domain-containing protein [Anaerolineales bacterium HSG25]
MKNSTITLAIGDLVALLLIVWLGRLSHVISIWDVGQWLYTAFPFVLAWFVIMPWFGVYQTEIHQNWRRLLPRLLLGWTLVGLPLGLMMRSFILGRPIIAGIMPTFAMVMVITTTSAILGWRFVHQRWFLQAGSSSA